MGTEAVLLVVFLIVTSHRVANDSVALVHDSEGKRSRRENNKSTLY